MHSQEVEDGVWDGSRPDEGVVGGGGGDFMNVRRKGLR